MQGRSIQGSETASGGDGWLNVEKLTNDDLPYTATLSDGLIKVHNSTACVITLPASPPPGKVLRIKAGATTSVSAPITITAHGTDKIDGGATFILSFSFSALTLIADGDMGWVVF